MNGNMLMLLLPFLMKNGGGTGEGFRLTPEMISGLMGNGAQNPMMAMLLAMMQKNAPKVATTASGGEEKRRDATDAPPEIGSLFGKDVAGVLKTFMEMKGQSGSV